MPSWMCHRSHCLTLLLAVAAACTSGCDPDEIDEYYVPREPIAETAPPAASPHAALAPQSDQPAPQTPPMMQMPAPAAGTDGRMLAAMVEHDDRVWFFKLIGDDPAVAAQRGAFDAFMQSLQFHHGADAQPKPIGWTLPAGWTEQPGSGMRYATIVIEQDGDPLELSVISLGLAAGDVLDNVNRWRGQLGLAAVSEAQLPSTVRTIDRDGHAVIIVDIAAQDEAAEGDY